MSEFRYELERLQTADCRSSQAVGTRHGTDGLSSTENEFFRSFANFWSFRGIFSCDAFLSTLELILRSHHRVVVTVTLSSSSIGLYFWKKLVQKVEFNWLVSKLKKRPIYWTKRETQSKILMGYTSSLHCPNFRLNISCLKIREQVD